MVKPCCLRGTLLGLSIAAAALCVGCDKAKPPQRAAAPAPPASTTATAPDIAALTRHYADLMAHRAHLPTAASREGATPFTNGGTEVQGYSRRLCNCQVYLDLDATFLLKSVSIETIPLPEDPKRLVLQVPPRPPRLVRLGDLRREFGPEQKADGRAEETYTFNFAYHPRPQLCPVILQAEIPAFKLMDSTMVERLLLLPAQPQ